MLRISNPRLSCFAFFALVVLFTAATLAQDASTGVIRGTVVDPSGGRIRGATVAFVNAATGFRYAATTDSLATFPRKSEGFEERKQ